jgi:hypothetical protein
MTSAWTTLRSETNSMKDVTCSVAEPLYPWNFEIYLLDPGVGSLFEYPRMLEKSKGPNNRASNISRINDISSLVNLQNEILI